MHMWASFTGMYFQCFVPYIILMHKVANLFIKAENVSVCVVGCVKDFLTIRNENKDGFAFARTCCWWLKVAFFYP